jgi:hypothetical protein
MEFTAGTQQPKPQPPRPTPTASWCGIYERWYDQEFCPFCLPGYKEYNDQMIAEVEEWENRFNQSDRRHPDDI